jgi:F0F1-type ATP synthase membrane subunit c/vacuolar-type H+-ATPase subunit K
MGTMLILIFGEVLGLYGFIVSILLSSKKHSYESIVFAHSV